MSDRLPELGGPALIAGQVHLWRVSLDQPREVLPGLWLHLSDDERQRAAGLRSELDRTRYVTAHAALRMLLAGYRKAPWCRDPFAIGPNGKPSLRTGENLFFNLTHSMGAGLVAVTAGAEVGVDLEAVNLDVPIDELASGYFSSLERAGLERLGPQVLREGFFHVWSQKQAYLKARGDGIAGGMDHFDVIPDPRQGAGLLADRRDPGAPLRWSLLPFDSAPGFRGAVAVAARSPSMLQFDWGDGLPQLL